jgi:uncharacterized protein
VLLEKAPRVIAPPLPRLSPMRPPPRERVLALVGLALVAAHAVDGAFVDLRPGASVATHVPWAAALLAVVVAAAVSGPRWPRGVRASVFALLAVPAVFDGIQHVKYVHSDFSLTGLGVLGGGFALAAAAVLAAWGTNRGKPRRRGWRNRALATAGALVVAVFVVVPLTLAIYFVHKPLATIGRPDLGVPGQEVAFHADDGPLIHGWYVRPRNGAVVLGLHGAGGDRNGTRAQARMLVRHGYGVLALDARGRGRSGGDVESYGWHWDRDVRAGVTFVESRPGVRSVGVFGLSTGAEVAMQAAAADPRIRAVVADGVQQRTLSDARSTPGAARFLLVPVAAVSQVAYQFLTLSSPPPPLKKVVAEISRRPLLLIGTKDELPIDRVWFRYAKRPKQLYALPDTAHTKGLATHPRAYERRVIGFFDRALLR